MVVDGGGVGVSIFGGVNNADGQLEGEGRQLLVETRGTAITRNSEVEGME